MEEISLMDLVSLPSAVSGDNVTSSLKYRPNGPPGLPVYGLNTIDFYLVHIAAICSLTISILFSFGVLGYLFCPCQCKDFQPNIGQRLVIYLAICDLGWSTSHMMDHTYMFITKDHPPSLFCQTAAFFMGQFVVAQAIIVSFTALNAFILLVKERRLSLGSHDWKLLSVAFIVPFSITMVPAVLGYLGPSGAW